MKIVTRLEALTKTKYQVELDGVPAFILYKGELSRFGIREGTQLAEETYEKLMQEVLLVRAKQKAMELLSCADQTEAELRQKLKRGMYPPEIIEEAVDYVRSFSYLDDDRYAENFILSRKDKKSRKEIYALLCAKGISPQQAESALEEYCGQEDQIEAIRRILKKKGVDFSSISEQERYKIYGSLARKGFRYEDIRQVIQNRNENA